MAEHICVVCKVQIVLIILLRVSLKLIVLICCMFYLSLRKMSREDGVVRFVVCFTFL